MSWQHSDHEMNRRYVISWILPFIGILLIYLLTYMLNQSQLRFHSSLIPKSLRKVQMCIIYTPTYSKKNKLYVERERMMEKIKYGFSPWGGLKGSFANMFLKRWQHSNTEFLGLEIVVSGEFAVTYLSCNPAPWCVHRHHPSCPWSPEPNVPRECVAARRPAAQWLVWGFQSWSSPWASGSRQTAQPAGRWSPPGHTGPPRSWRLSGRMEEMICQFPGFLQSLCLLSWWWDWWAIFQFHSFIICTAPLQGHREERSWPWARGEERPWQVIG